MQKKKNKRLINNQRSSSKRLIPQKLPTIGHKAGTKRSDRRWIDDKGQLWASRFECKVFESGQRASLALRKCDKGGSDTFPYHSPVRNGVCESCQSTDVVQQRTYTPDLCIISDTGTEGGGQSKRYIEVKGFARANQRSLLRSFRETGEAIDLRFILQANYRVGKLTFGGWVSKYLRCPWVVFTGEWPLDSEWIIPVAKTLESKKSRRRKGATKEG